MSSNLGTISAILMVINSMLGSGINYMPAAFMNSGFLFSWIFLFIVSTFTILSIIAITISSKNFGDNPSYSGLGAKFSPKLKYFIDFCLLFSSIFTGIAFQKYITNLIVAFIPVHYKVNIDTYYLEVFLTVSMSIILFIMVQIEKFSNLKFFSYISVACIGSLLSLLAFCNFYLSDYIGNHVVADPISYNYTFSISYFIFALCCQANMVELYSCLENKRMYNILIVSICAPLCGFLIYGFGGFLGYRLIGNSIGQQDIIKIFSDNNSHINQYLELNNIFLWYALKIQSFFAIFVLISGFPMQVAPAIAAIKRFFRYDNSLSKKIHQIVATSVLFLITAFNCIPNIEAGRIFELLSISSDNFISFLFPFIFLLIHMKIRSNILKFLVCLLLIPSCLIFFNGIKDIFVSLFIEDLSQNTNKTSINNVN